MFLATQRGLDRPVVIKLLHASIERDPEFVERFLREAHVTAALRHPHIVEVVDHDVEDGVPWIAYEYLAGPTLRESLADGPLDPGQAAEIARQMALALGAAHAQGVLHRDIKPDNIMAHAEGHWKLTDFGIARWAEDAQVKTATGIVLGTPEYLAPEVILGSPASPRSDLYSLGVTLFEMLTGEMPHTGDLRTILTHQKSGKGQRPSERRQGLPATLDDLVRAALAYDVSARPPSAAALASGLAAAVDAATSPSPPQRAVRTRVLQRSPMTDAGTQILRGTPAGADASGSRLRTEGLSPPGSRTGVPPERRPGPGTHAGSPGNAGAGVPGGLPAGSSRVTRRWLTGAMAAAIVVAAGLAGLALARVTARHPKEQALPSSSAPPGVSIAGVRPLPPRRAAVDLVAPAGEHPVLACVDLSPGGRERTVLTTSLRSEVDGLLPGGRYTLSVRSRPDSPVTSRWTFVEPRPIDATADAVPGETDVVVSVWSMAPVRLSATIQRVDEGSVVWRWQGTPDAAYREVVQRLHPDTKYMLKVEPEDTQGYVPVPSVEFRTKPRGHHDRVLGLMRAFFNPPVEALSASFEATRMSGGGGLATAVDAGCSAELVTLARRPDVIREPMRCLVLIEALGDLHEPAALGPLVDILKQATPEDTHRLISALSDLHRREAADALMDRAREWPLHFYRAHEMASAAVQSHPGRALELARTITRRGASATLMELACAVEVIAQESEDLAARELIDLALRAPSLPSVVAAARAMRDLGREARVQDARKLLALATSPPLSTTCAADDDLRMGIFLLEDTLALVGAPRDADLALPLLDGARGDKAVLGALDLLLAKGGAQDRQRVAILVGGRDPQQARLAALALGHARAAEGVAPILARLDDHAVSLGRFPRALGQIGDPAVVPRLARSAALGLARLGRPDSAGVSSSAIVNVAEMVWALGRLGDRNSFDLVLDALKSPWWYVRLRAAQGLGWSRDKRAAAALSAMAAAKDEPHVVRDAASQALAWIAQGPPAGPVVELDPLDGALGTGLLVVPGDVVIPHVTGGSCEAKDIASREGGLTLWQGFQMSTRTSTSLATAEPNWLTVHHAGELFVTPDVAPAPIIPDMASAVGFQTLWFERRDDITMRPAAHSSLDELGHGLDRPGLH